MNELDSLVPYEVTLKWTAQKTITVNARSFNEAEYIVKSNLNAITESGSRVESEPVFIPLIKRNGTTTSTEQHVS